MANVAEVVVEALVQHGVKRIFGLPGDSLNGITEAIRVRKDIAWIHVRNEEAAAFAAGAEAHLSDRLAVCAGSCGPGNLHLINGLFDCHRSRVPVLAIAAQIPSTELGTGYFQETHPEQVFKDCCDYCGVISEPDQITRILSIAIRTAIAKRGVAVIVIPGNIATRPSASPAVHSGFLANDSGVVPPAEELQRAADLLNAAGKVTILGGAGCVGAHAEVLKIAEQLKAPVVHALRGKEHLEYDNPFDVGMTGLLGFTSGYAAMMHADALLVLGTDFPYPQFYPKDAKIIQVDVRGEQIGRRAHVDVGLIGTVKHTIQALLPLLNAQKNDSFLKKSVDHYRSARKDLDELATAKPESGPLHPEFVTRVLDEVASQDTIFTCDVGTPTVWAARYLTMNGRRRLIGSFTHGSMASALPQALGAQAANPGRQVISMSGDGGLSMLMGELLTAKQNKLPVKIIVYNNGSLAFVELEMKSAGLLSFGTDLDNPDFVQLATSCGLLGLLVEKPDQLRPALESAFAHPGPALIEVRVFRQELSMPPTITAEQAKGFGLYLLRAVMNGRGDEVIDLAHANVLSRIFG